MTLMIIFWPVFLLGTPAQKRTSVPNCSTDLLSRMAEVIGLDSLCILNSKTDTVLTLPYGDEQLRVEAKGGVIDHIGLRLFSDTLREVKSIEAPLDYLERTVLLNRLPLDREITIRQEADSHDVLFDGITLDSIPALCRMTKDVTVNFINERVYSIVWNIDSTHSAIATIPAHYNMLRGTTLPENERRLFDELVMADSLQHNHCLSPVNEDLVQGTWKTNCFVIKGDSLFSKHLNSDIYYQMADSASDVFFEELYNKAYPVESFSNLLKGLRIPNDFRIRVKLMIYPRSLMTVNMNLSTLAAYFLSHGCQIFTIPTEVSDDRIRLWMLCKNTYLGYCHSLRVTFNAEDVESRDGTATASLAPFIPINKINKIFADIKSQ